MLTIKSDLTYFHKAGGVLQSFKDVIECPRIARAQFIQLQLKVRIQTYSKMIAQTLIKATRRKTIFVEENNFLLTQI